MLLAGGAGKLALPALFRLVVGLHGFLAIAAHKVEVGLAHAFALPFSGDEIEGSSSAYTHNSLTTVTYAKDSGGQWRQISITGNVPNGTSGAVLYFSSPSSAASSAALTQNALVVGGGPAQPPATVNRWTIDGNSNLTATKNATTLPAAPVTSIARLADADTVSTTLLLDSAGSTSGNQIALRASRGTVSNPGVNQAGDTLGALSAYGRASTGYSASYRAAIQLQADGTWSDTSQPTAINLVVCPTGTTSPQSAMTVHNSGGITVGSATDEGAGTLNVQHGLYVNGVLLASTLSLPNPGTSGGVPYYTSNTTVASSAALSLGNLVCGGGSGSAPFTSSTFAIFSNQFIGNLNSSSLPTPLTNSIMQVGQSDGVGSVFEIDPLRKSL